MLNDSFCYSDVTIENLKRDTGLEGLFRRAHHCVFLIEFYAIVIMIQISCQFFPAVYSSQEARIGMSLDVGLPFSRLGVVTVVVFKFRDN